MFVTTIACRLADSKAPGIHQYMHDSEGEHCQIANETLQDQGKQLVLQPLSRHQKRDIRRMFVIVVADCANRASRLHVRSHLLED